MEAGRVAGGVFMRIVIEAVNGDGSESARDDFET